MLLGLADFGLLNFKLGPEYAEEQAKLAPTTGTAPVKSAAQPPAPVGPPTTPKSASVPVAPPQPTEPTPPASASAEPSPPASATAEPTPTVEPPKPTPTATPPVVASGEKPGAVEDIMFELDSPLLTLSSKSTLDDVVTKLKANSSLRVHLRGHSDQLGARDHNLELSRKRAAAVEGFLLTNGIARGRITTEAVGGSKPADSSNTPAAWARNRRVEIEWR